MAKVKYRTTPFARLLLLLLIVVPAAWFGVSYYKGEDPVATFKEWVGWENTSPKVENQHAPNTPRPTTNEETIVLDKQTYDALIDRIDDLNRRVQALERKAQ